MSKLPPPNRIPQNLTGMKYFEITKIKVANYHPLPNGQGPPTQVHLHLTVKGIPHPLVLRFKGTDTLDKLIGMLQRHRYDVWPLGGPLDVEQ
jgi:hypothetical protein